MPDDPQRQLDAIKRNMCGDCGVGPFKGGRRVGGWRMSRRAAVAMGVAGLILIGVVLMWLGG